MTKFAGALTALVTPFRAGAVDEAALRKLVAAQIDGGIHGLVPCGTTGESVNLSLAEYEQVVRAVVDESRGRVPVVAGAGTASTAHTIELAQIAKRVGADGLLGVTPYYNRPGPSGLLAHFRALTAAVDLPLVLYNIPGRTGSDLTLAELHQLADNPRIIGIKEATNTVARSMQIVQEFGDRFTVLSGDDALTLPIMAVGGQGVISVASNVLPAQVVALVDQMRAGDLPASRQANGALLPWIKAAYVESNPVPTKAALAMLGRMESEVRLPLAPLGKASEETVRSTLAAMGLL